MSSITINNCKGTIIKGNIRTILYSSKDIILLSVRLKKITLSYNHIKI